MGTDDLDDVENMAVVRNLMEEVLSAGRLALLPDLIAPDFVGHLAIGDHYGPEGVRIEFAAYRDAIRDLTVTLHHLFAVEDRVARRFTLQGTCSHNHQPVTAHGIAIDHLERGRLVESWVHINGIPDGEPLG